jgi:hypothetical protein
MIDICTSNVKEMLHYVFVKRDVWRYIETTQENL